ncbi:hypothetical protein D0B54_03850 [Solimonas sp. K1W22B-7]|uniref:hypothetical protein n=1 Tax=Solimonas sp. K1W22B-7 TaxID=2303331 RepID=UPI000E331B85|nr:hypothetical protein [Solimonas sp. K1W22B-7]AXQ27862.1 hypothetical protein D0B54_03850 [Solimonas sp. K1W22B-7]
MSIRQVEVPDNSSGDMNFTATKVVAAVPHSHAYSPHATASSVLFTDLSARAQDAGGVAAISATLQTTLEGRAPGRVRIDVRGKVVLSAGAKAAVYVLDGSTRRGKKFTNRDQDLFISWTRRAKPGEVLQLTLFATTRVTAKVGGGLEGFVELDSIDMVSLASKK